MDTPMMYSPTFEPPFVIDKSRDRLQVRLRKDHLEGYVLINLPHYDPIRALEAAMSVVNDFDITTLNKPHGSNSSGWMSLTEHPSCSATTLSAGVQFALPLAALRGNHNQTRLVPPAGMQQDNRQHIVAPTLKTPPVRVKGTKRTRPKDDGDEQPSPKRLDTQGLSRWFPWSSTSPEPNGGKYGNHEGPLLDLTTTWE